MGIYYGLNFPNVFGRCFFKYSKLSLYFFPFSETLSKDYHESRILSGLGGETSSYLAARLTTDIEFRKQLKKPRFFVKEMNGISKVVETDLDDVAYYSKIDKVDERCSIFFSIIYLRIISTYIS